MDCLIIVGSILLGIYLVIGVICCFNMFDGVWEPEPTIRQMMVMWIMGIIFWPIIVIKEYF